ncbi:MAG: hypothetical protein AAGC57_03350 [Pseudomonadota bacterium]
MQDAHSWLSDVLRARPELVQAPQRPGYRRGIDVMRREQLGFSLGAGLQMFRRIHNRMPDLINDPWVNDHYFAMKYFGFIPEPNPADKLNTGRYIPEPLRDQIRVPRKLYVATEPVLPPDDAIPPGPYYMKRALGCKTNARVQWPPSPEERAAHEATLRRWMGEPYGVAWGEWWYGWGPDRWFLEEDLTALIENQHNWHYWVRDGQAVLGQILVGTRPDSMDDNAQRWFHPDLTPIDAITVRRRPFDGRLPDRAQRYFELASAIGARFDVVRVDIWDSVEGPPVLGELTLCDYHCQRRFNPPEFGRTMGQILFGQQQAGLSCPAA